MADSTAIIAGGSRGLGLALARSQVDDGWHVVIDALSHDKLAAASDELAGRGSVRAIAGDVTDPDHRAALVEAAVELGGGVDLLVHNASHLVPAPSRGWPTTRSPASHACTTSTSPPPWP